MAWVLVMSGSDWVWRCSSYAELDQVAINNLAEYGQPFDPHNYSKFNHDYYNKRTDFSNVIVEMPQSEVMISGYGRGVRLTDFSATGKFFEDDFSSFFKKGLKISDGNYSFNDLLKASIFDKDDRIYAFRLYKTPFGFGDAGSIDATQAAYVHGTVALALMSGTRFIVNGKVRTINAEIGAMHDNFDFESNSLVVNSLEGVVQFLAGPGNFNITKPITMRYYGPGIFKTMSKSF